MVLILVGVLAVTYVIDKELESLNFEISRPNIQAVEVREPAQPVGVLLLGLDSVNGGFDDNSSRSDAIIVASINPKTQTTELVTIPRDTVVEMGREGQQLDKINHSYMYGGVDLTIQTVSNYLDFPIHYVVEMNMTGLEDLVDALDGILLTPTITFTDKGYAFVEGEPTLMSGHQALTYSRMRKKDPKGDVGRGERQQEVIQSIVSKLKSVDAVTNYRDLLDVVKGNMLTNARISSGLIADYMPSMNNINRTMLEERYDYNIEGVYYLGIPEQKRKEISNTLRNNIGLSDTRTNKQYIVDNASKGVLKDYYIPNYDEVETEGSYGSNY